MCAVERLALSIARAPSRAIARDTAPHSASRMRAAARWGARESCARARGAARRAHGADATKTVPTYGDAGAFFVGATANSGRGAYAARAIGANETVITRERPLVWHRTMANARSRCEWCLRASAGGATCETCEDARRRAYGDFEKARGVDLRALEAYCEKNDGLKFPLMAARAASMIASGTLSASALEWLCKANDVETNPPAQWLEECEILRRAFGDAGKDIITPAWYAGITSRFHLNSFRVEIPVDVAPASTDFKSALSAGLDAITQGTASGSAVYKYISLLNHSCAPNCDARWEHGDSSLTIRANRDVAPGEALTIAYVDTDIPRDVRRARLARSYAFDCACSRCAAGE